MIKSKITYYRGTRFRSHLESQWASMFDRLGYRWQYEPKCFTVSKGGYLPDFYLSDLGMWAEVKPGFLDDVALQKIMDVSSQTGENALLLEGNPSQKVRMVQPSGDMQDLGNYKGLVIGSFQFSKRCN